ncbi:hypothetical protein KL953_15855 [Mycolicibacterium goodii]|uniref:hypothetical protein n=1 Tax=Mycolicibacterium goodii TaxID=134601 RepID=UPI001BDBBB03|nr:hypothetical protein [Mycolicibacterium goodii]MBU8810360.1 hypothetical protein [Mycolicibacterium goodii]
MAIRRLTCGSAVVAALGGTPLAVRAAVPGTQPRRPWGDFGGCQDPGGHPDSGSGGHDDGGSAHPIDAPGRPRGPGGPAGPGAPGGPEDPGEGPPTPTVLA